MFTLERGCLLILAIAILTTISISARAAPGDDPACVTVEGFTTVGTSSTLKFDIGGETACEQHDQFTFGELTLEGATLKIRLITGYVPSGGEVFDVLNWGTLTGVFSEPVDITEAVLAEGLEWDTSQLYITGAIAVTGSAAAEQLPFPEWMLFLLVIVLFGVGWRRVAVRGD